MPFECSPQKLVYGGDALGHYRGRPVLMPRALPGERVEVETVRTAKGVVHARPLRILEAAPDRVEPPCPYFGRCGGCQYQHLEPAKQADAKREILRETLRRIGKIAWQGEIPVHAGPAWNYRNQARLKVVLGPDGRTALGFFEAESHQLFPIDVCLILSPRLNAILGALLRPEWTRRLAGCREIELLADDRDECAMVTLCGRLEPSEAEALAGEALRELPGVVSVAAERGRDCEVFGQPTLAYRVGKFEYRVSAGSFFQASRFLLGELVAAVTGSESQPSTTGSDALSIDLFAGVGLFTLPLARRFAQVIGVEAHPKAAADLRANVRAQGFGNVRAVDESAFDFLRRFAQVEPDLVVLDPPRAGVDAGTLKLLTACRPRRIHYVSCSPPTLARDLGYLVSRGYRLDSIELFDFFPQTYHLECLAKLTPSAPSSF